MSDEVIVDTLVIQGRAKARLKKARTVNRNWPRWIFVSASRYFYNNRGELPFTIEGQSADIDPHRESIEFRMNGPVCKNPSGGYWRLDINIETFLQVAHNEEDAHRVQRLVGQCCAMFAPSIEVFKYGNGPDDDKSYLGCLIINQDEGDMVIVNNFGIVSSDIPMYQASINASYKMELTVPN